MWIDHVWNIKKVGVEYVPIKVPLNSDCMVGHNSDRFYTSKEEAAAEAARLNLPALDLDARYRKALADYGDSIDRREQQVMDATDYAIEDGICPQSYQDGLLLMVKTVCIINFDRKITGRPREIVRESKV